jgi:Spy/CpxP family protein refolding chaperone
MNTKILALLFTSLVGIFTACAQSETNAPAEPPRTTQRLQGMIAGGAFPFFRQLNEDQRAKIRAANEADREKFLELQGKIRDARRELFVLQLAEKFDVAAFREKSAAIGKFQTEIDLMSARAFAAVRPTLSEDQVQKMKDALKNMQSQQPRRSPAPEATAPAKQD